MRRANHFASWQMTFHALRFGVLELQLTPSSPPNVGRLIEADAKSDSRSAADLPGTGGERWLFSWVAAELFARLLHEQGAQRRLFKTRLSVIPLSLTNPVT